MNKRNYNKAVVVTGGVLLMAMATWAQDTTKKRSIDITSTFKPVLREAVKINFNGAPPVPDSAKPRLTYIIPPQTLSFAYRPGTLQPMELQADTSAAWQNTGYLKVGAGNVFLPYVQGAVSFGDKKKTFLTASAKHYTAKGKEDFQKNSLTELALDGTMKTASNLEVSGKLGFKTEDYYLYGYEPKTLAFTNNELLQRYQTFNLGVGLRNLVPTEYGLVYNPTLKVSAFNGKNNGNSVSEVNTLIDLPLQKTFGQSFGLNLGVTADLTNYKPLGKSSLNNNVFYVTPALLLQTPNVVAQISVMPSWENSNFKLLPNFMADINTSDKKFTVQLGWLGSYEKGSYQRFASIVPWLALPDSNMANTRVQEFYGGFKGSFLNHFMYSAKVGWKKHFNMPLFVNDDVDGKTFKPLYSPLVEAVQIHGELGYVRGEVFSAKAGLTWRRFSTIENQTRAYGLVPFEMNADLRWMLFKDLYLSSELYLFDGAAYLSKSRQAFKGDKGIDLSAAVEYKLTHQFNLWVRMNNLFNSTYQRWNQYPVYGFNIMGGVVFSFKY